MPNLNARPTCARCRRPVSACWCGALTPVETATRVVFLQHPREARVAIGTARMAHLGLRRSELHEGIEFGAHPRVAEVVAAPGTMLLFPGEGAVAPESLPHPPETLLVLDGTWPQARKMMALNPALRALPRIGFVPSKPGNYRIRREPAAHCVATIEAVVEVLAALEQDATRFAPLLRSFESMVDLQIAAKAARSEPARRHITAPDPWWISAAMPDLQSMWPRLVAVAGEANAHSRLTAVPGPPEVIQLAAVRVATGDAFHALLAPRRSLGTRVAHHLGVSEDSILSGHDVTEVLEEWNRFLHPEDRLIGWGSFAWELLAQEGWHPGHDPIDLRLVAAHRLKRRAGAAESAAKAVGGQVESLPNIPGRAGRNLESIAAFTRALLDEKRTFIEGIVASRNAEKLFP